MSSPCKIENVHLVYAELGAKPTDTPALEGIKFSQLDVNARIAAML